MEENKRRAKQRRWSADDVIREIHACNDMSAKYNQRALPHLYGAAVRYFGSWKKAVEAAGFDYKVICKRRQPGSWSKDQIIQTIKDLKQMNSSFVRKSNSALYNAALRNFGSWKNAIEAAGLDYIQIKKGWIAEDDSLLRYRRKD